MQEPNSSISNFNKFLLKIFLPLIVILSVMAVVFDYFFERKIVMSSQIAGAYKVNRIVNETHGDEIPVFGSSRADGCFIPDSLGPNYFNYGIIGTRFDVTLFFIEEECKKRKSHPSLIINVDLEGIFSGIGNVANYVPNSNYEPVRILFGRQYHSYYRIPLLRNFGLFESYLADYFNDKMQVTKYSNNGASLERKVLTAQQFKTLVEERQNTSTTFVTEPALVQRLQNVIASHPERDFVIVVAPYHSSYFAKYTNMPVAKQFFAQLNSFKNVRVLDYSKMSLEDSLYFNTTHLNYKGAAIFSRQLKDTLLQIKHKTERA